MLLNQIKGIKVSLNLCTLREIKNYINDFRRSLNDYRFNSNNEVDEIKEYQIYKLCCKIDDTDIYDLKYNEIISYIDSLISITEFIEI